MCGELSAESSNAGASVEDDVVGSSPYVDTACISPEARKTLGSARKRTPYAPKSEVKSHMDTDLVSVKSRIKHEIRGKVEMTVWKW